MYLKHMNALYKLHACFFLIQLYLIILLLKLQNDDPGRRLYDG